MTILLKYIILSNINKDCNKQSCYKIQKKLNSWIKLNCLIYRTCCYAQKRFAKWAGLWLLIFQTVSWKTDYNPNHIFFDTIDINISVEIKPSTKGFSILVQSEPCIKYGAFGALFTSWLKYFGRGCSTKFSESDLQTSFSSQYSKHHTSQPIRDTFEKKFTPLYVPCVMCHLSPLICNFIYIGRGGLPPNFFDRIFFFI